MLKTYAVKYYLRGFGHAVYQIAEARDALHAALVLSAILKGKHRAHLDDFEINEVTPATTRFDQWPTINASEVPNA